MQKTEIVKYQPKDVFKEYKDDTFEILQQVINSDNKVIRYLEVCDGDVQDAKKTEDKIKENFKQIKKIFNYLQTKSRRFPLIDRHTLFEYFIKPTEIVKRTNLQQNEFEIIFLESQFDSKDKNEHVT